MKKSTLAILISVASVLVALAAAAAVIYGIVKRYERQLEKYPPVEQPDFSDCVL